MYEVYIKTKYNVITFKVDDLQDKRLIEIQTQPYVEEIRIEKIKVLTKENK